MRSALGKGLSALLSDETAASVSAAAPTPTVSGPAADPTKLPIEKIHANPKQPRQHFSEESLNELSDSIQEHGIIQPILVSAQADGTYEIIAGERRWRAAQRVGLKEVPVVIRNSSETVNFQLSLIENIQRMDLNPVELAKGYKRLQDEFGMTQEAVAKSVGKDRAVIANTLRLLNLHADIVTALQEGKLSAGHARTLAGLDDLQAQLELFHKILAEQLPVRAVEEAVRAKKKGAVREHVRTNGYDKKPNEVRLLEEEMQHHLTRKVELQETDRASHRGWLKLEFYSLDDLDTLLARLKKS